MSTSHCKDIPNLLNAKKKKKLYEAGLRPCSFFNPFPPVSLVRSAAGNALHVPKSGHKKSRAGWHSPSELGPLDHPLFHLIHTATLGSIFSPSYRWGNSEKLKQLAQGHTAKKSYKPRVWIQVYLMLRMTANLSLHQAPSGLQWTDPKRSGGSFPGCWPQGQPNSARQNSHQEKGHLEEMYKLCI